MISCIDLTAMSDTSKIILSQFLTTLGLMWIAVYVFNRTKKTEKDLIRENLKIEICGICDRIMRHSGTFEISRVHHFYNSRLSELSPIPNAKEALKNEAADFLKRTNDASIKLFLTKSELVEKSSHLFLYLESKSEREKIKTLITQIHDHTFPDEGALSKKYIAAKNIIELTQIWNIDKNNISNPPQDTEIQKYCKEIQVMVNPIFYK